MLNTGQLSQETLEGAMMRLNLQYEDNLYAKLTNYRSMEGSKVDQRREIVLTGHEKIMKFVERGVK